ncbi:MAG: ribosome hibernation-promoting factor, HPF/YfiA family [Paracoccus hibiscisoli]|uniref:ribosome hibernation-promoting factor, HPF/YfiA family n=1 Tax=Paracoccus TaxID=265 RepID=UPI00086F55A1|nr:MULTISPECIES: ribosome-associated translation inhibitor RaiA [Paracoccus]ODT60687.1 MAG: ribosomal subunit interface protein [Paracoccus sp. SCN 68-21]
MRYTISGKHIDVGDALTTHVKTELGETLEKYSQRPTDASVTFSKDAHQFLCDTVVHLSTGLTVQARGHANDNIYAAFEACREKMDKQLRRYKRRLKDHHKDHAEPVVFGQADSYVLAAEDDDAESQGGSLEPIIIAEMESRVPTLSVGDAVMHMELSGSPLLVFRNEKHGGVNVVHRRDDGNVGWIDPRGNG